jgi:hypothetical protein
MTKFIRFIILFSLSISAYSQNINQGFYGSVKDAWTQKPIAFANVTLFTNGQLVKGAVSDSLGALVMNELPPGRYKLVVSFTGYQSYESEILIISGKSLRLELLLEESKKVLEEVVVIPPSVSIANTTTIPIEKALRVPANFFDPVRMLTSYPGVVTGNDQSNAIIVKGYSPNAINWRLQGLDIINPNHLANAGTFSDKPNANGGGVNVLSAQLLDRTDFYSGALPVQYGNALSGSMDMTLRPGNSDRMQYTAQASVIGLDVAAEGPLSKSGKSSFLANYRYSTVGLLSEMGVDFGGEKINFQDFSFHLNVPGKKGGNLSMFGFGGLSSNQFAAKPEDEWETEKDRYTIDFTGNVAGVGIVNQFKPGWATVTTGVSFSAQNQERESQGTMVSYPTIYRESYTSKQQLFSAFVKGIKKLNTAGFVESGIRVNYSQHELDVLSVNQFYIDILGNVNGTVSGLLWQPYFAWSQQVGKFNLGAGLRYVYFTYNESSALEPRLNIARAWNNNTITLAYSLVSQTQQTQTYLSNVDNNNLSFTKSNQFSLELRKKLAGDLSVVSSLYYHQLLDAPVYVNNEMYNMLNQWDDYPNERMENTGKGRNYGVEAYIEKRFYRDLYFMISGSYYESQFLANGKYFDTRFNGNFTSSFLTGKEWIKPEKAFGVHVRVLYTGGLRQPAIDTFASSLVGTTIFNLGRGFVTQYPDYFRTDLRISWRKNKPSYTRTLSIDIQNLTNYQNIANVYFDTYQYHQTMQENTIRYQVGIIPVLAYRIDF